MNLAQFAEQMRPSGATPPTVEAIYASGYYWYERGRYADAAKVFRVMLHAAPRDERAWLALGECHERIGQVRIALELYGAGASVATPSVRCQLARARALRALDRGEEADLVLDAAEHEAADRADDELIALVAGERRWMP